LFCIDGWRERWVESTYKGSEQGAWGWTAGKFYGDAERDKGDLMEFLCITVHNVLGFVV